jgi:uncharacterized membrane protein
MIIPTSGGGVMILPDNGPSGPLTPGDTKIAIVIVILAIVMMLLAVLIERLRGFTFREIFTLSEDGWSRMLTAYTIISMILFYIVTVGSLLGGLGYFIYTQL